MTDLQKTPLHQAHLDLSAKMVDFGGWHMPLQYEGIIKEHKATRSGVGLFDVSHMGEVRLVGPQALAATQRLVTNNIGKLTDGAALYTVMCLPSGGIVDDCIVYRHAADNILIILNASNRAKDVAWIKENVGSMVQVIDESDDTALIAVQGPKALALLDSMSSQKLSDVPRFHLATCEVGGVPVVAARTGYTGEEGFELACRNDHAMKLWSELLRGGESFGTKPCGLGARDTLRLEAKLSLYGNDIDETTSPLEAGLGWVVKFDAGDFVGKAALEKQKAEGIKRSLVGFTISGRGIARHGYPIVDRSRAASEQTVGLVTSGTSGISVEGAIAMGYVPVGSSAPGTVLTVDCRGKDVEGTVVKGAFYRRPAG